MPNLIKISEMFAEIWRFSGFQNGGRQPSCIFEIQTFNGRYPVTAPNLIKIGQMVAKIRQFNFFFQNGGCRHLGFVESVFGPPTIST